MNKKFFTLIASVFVLAGLVGSASGQGQTIPQGTIPSTIINGGKYQIALTTVENLTNSAISSYSSYSDWLDDATDPTAAENIYKKLLAVQTGFDVTSANSTAGPNADGIIGKSLPLWYAYIAKDGQIKGDPWKYVAGANPNSTVDDVPGFTGNYYESIFCVTKSRYDGQGGQRTILNLFSYAHGFELLVDVRDTTGNAQTLYDTRTGQFISYGTVPTQPTDKFTVANYPTLNAGRGTLGGWGYSGGYGNGEDQHWLPLYIYNPNNSAEVFLFIADADAPNSLRLLKWPISKFLRGNIPGSAILFEFINPAPRVLAAEDFNTKLGTDLQGKNKGQYLSFKTDTKAGIYAPKFIDTNPSSNLSQTEQDLYSPWGETKVKAIDVVRYSSSNASFKDPLDNITDNNGHWLYFENVSGDENVLGKILRIDTAYYGNANNGDGTLKFQWGDTLSAISAVTNTTAQTIYKYSDEAAYNAEIYGSNYRNYPSVGVSGYRVNIDGFYNRTMAAVSDFINHYRFQATYFWAEDSLAIDVAQANLRPQISSLPPFYLAHDYIKLWEQPYYEWAIIEDKNDTGTSAAGAASLNFTSNTQATEEYKKNLLTGASLNRTDGDLLHVRLNSFDGGSRGLTVGDRPLAVKPQFKDFPNCTPDNPSLPEGVYIIRNNTLDKLLTVPIYSDTTAQWVTKKETVDPTRLPSYQWIAKLVNKSNPETSPITFINREFPTVRLENVRLPHDGETITLASQYELVNNQSSFERITDEKILKNKYLGYFHATGDPIETYDLNYLDQNAGINLSKENAGLFLNKGDKSTDSTLLVSTGRKLQFRIVPVAGAPTTDGKSRKAEHMYGYYVEGSDVQKEGVQLYRTAYQLLTDVIEDGKPVTKTLFINGEHRYALNNWVGGYYNSSLTNPGYNQGTFLLKTNNSATPFAKKDKEDFYALLDTTSISEYLQKTPNYGSSKNFSATDGTRGGNPKSSDAAERNLAGQPYDLRYVKLDIPEDAPWAYENDQTDRTTSAFAITRYNAPLYRRFDKQDYEYNNQEDPTLKIDEKFGDISESPLILKFHNSTRLADHLYENSPKSDLIGKSIFRDGLSPYGQAHTSFLGIYNTFEANELLKAEKDGDHVINYNFYVDTAFVRRETSTVGTPSKPATWDNYTNMPQYMLVVNPDTAGPAELKYQSGFYVWPEGAIAESGVWDKEANPYEEIKSINVPGLTVGDYLYNAQDSVNIGKNDFKGQIGSSIENATRLAFIRGAHLDDTFYVLAGTKYANYNAKQLQVLQGLTGVLYHDLSWYNKIYLGKNDHYTPRFDANWTAKAYADTIAKHKAQVGKALPDYLSTKSRNGKSMVFQFRLKNVAGMANELREFYIESQVSVGPEIGPASASFIHSFNGGAPVIAFSSFAAGRDYTNAALGLQVEAPTVDSVKQVTANEAAQISDAARVISGVNQISILNAAGKTVTVTNVLGQTVAKTVATSDNATITLPKGIVVVSVDGKSTKAVVK